MTADVGTTGVLLIDRQLPAFEVRQFTAVVVDAPPARVYEVVRNLDPEQVAGSFPLMAVLGRLRALPARLRRRPVEPEAMGADQASEAFVVLAEEPDREYVVGMVGKFMTATQLEFRRIEPPDFAGFAEPGYGKCALNFRVLPYGAGRSLLSTETRTATTDPESAVRFRRYWRVAGPFAGLIMRRWLRLAKQDAERPPQQPVTR